MTIAEPVRQSVSTAGDSQAPRKRTKISSGEGRLAFLLIGPTILLLGFVVGYPVVKAIIGSFQTDPTIPTGSPYFGSSGGWAGIDNYRYWLEQSCTTTTTGARVACPAGTLGSQFWSSVGVTLLFAFVTVVIETVIGVGFALVMNRAFKGKGIIRAVILIPWAIPTAITTKLWSVIFDPSGIMNAILGTHFQWTSEEWPARSAIIIADVWKTTPFIALLVLAGLQGISAELYEAARIDGATAWQRFTRITLPLVKPALAVAVIFRALDALRMYDLPAILTGGANGTRTLSILVVNQLQNANLNSASALSTLTFILLFAISLGLVKILGANIVGNQRPAKAGR